MDWPVSLKFGATGFGFGVGCGVGVGIGKPLDFGGVPVVNSMFSGLSSGISSISGSLKLDGATGRVYSALQSKGLAGGAGCGVGIGYGFGAGLMLRPAVLDTVVEKLLGLTGSFQQRLQTLGMQPDQGLAVTARDDDRARASAHPSSEPSAGPASLAEQMEPAAATEGWGSTPGDAQGRSSHDDLLSENLMLRALLRQQEQLEGVKQSNEQLRRALCKLDPGAEVCRDGGDPRP
mmetsp:Transcript_24657/g.58679  ORF Transcript_24657/g.58679 Transcript_24657/m.58679 type:complete len:234 (+) Transcript_24657:33-734(+)